MRIETWYFKQNAMSFFIGLMPVGKYVEYNHHPNFACECDVTCKDYFYLSSTSLPGGNQVDGLPPVASCINKINGQIGCIACRFGFVLEISTFNVA